jgi:hypothetical protein
MDRLPSLNGLLVWGATFCLVTRGMVPPAATAHDLATTSCLAGAGSCLAWTAWARAGLRRARAWAGRWR